MKHIECFEIWNLLKKNTVGRQDKEIHIAEALCKGHVLGREQISISVWDLEVGQLEFDDLEGGMNKRLDFERGVVES